MTNRLKRRVGQPGGKVWLTYNRGPATLNVKITRGNILHTISLHPDNIISSWTQPVVQVDITNDKQSANFSVVTYF